MTTFRARRRPSLILVGSAIFLALIVGAVVGAVITRVSHDSPTPSSTPGAHPRSDSPGRQTTPSAALTVSSSDPTTGAKGVLATGDITVTFSVAIAKASPLPSLSPVISGSWSINGHSITFHPSTAFTPLTAVTVTIPAGPSGVVGADGSRLVEPVVERFRIANGSVLRLQQLLSLLDYSPLSWTPSGLALAPNNASGQLAALYLPPPGTFAWREHGWPARLRALWKPGVDDVFTKGLIMSFQADHGLAPSGHVGPSLWIALIGAVGSNSVNTGGYNYALADKATPQSLTIFHDGKVVLRSPANTGIAGSPTPDGTFPVNTRLRRQVMRGTNPNGQKYADLVQYIAYFHGSDAVHYMDRADYGIPQSLGCIELPLADAARAWPYLAYGTLVTVID